MSGHTQTIRNGEVIRLNILPGDSIAVVAVSGTYNAAIVQGAGIGSLATAATGATYGPYNNGTVISLTASATSEIDFAIAVTPVITSDTIVPTIIGSTGAKGIALINIDAGDSGTAGSVDVFPATALKGKIAVLAADSAGNTTTTITNASQAAARTYTIPDAGAAASFVMTEGAQTINGVKTFGAISPLKATNAITAFATGGQASATALTSQVNSITVCATAGDSVRLPVSIAGSVIQVSNLGAAYANVFPASGDLIDALAANTALSLPVGKSLFFTCSVAGSWKSTSVVRPGARFSTGTTTTTFAAGQLTGANVVVYENTQATPGSIATRTATLMFADDPSARVGAAHNLRITNNQGTGTLTVTAGVGVTLTGTMTIAINTYRDFVVTYTSATALVIQQVGIGTAA